MRFNPEKHQRKSLRLPGFDYSQARHYFVTICVQHNACLFGEIVDGGMQLNDAGQMIAFWIAKVPSKYPTIGITTSVIMPNHIHLLLDFQSIMNTPKSSNHLHDIAPILGNVIGWFKTMTTNAYIHGVREQAWQPFNRKLWHRNYYEHIVRDQLAKERIHTYIEQNPARWWRDCMHP
jgi:putative transposase